MYIDVILSLISYGFPGNNIKSYTNHFVFFLYSILFPEDLATSISVSNCQVQENVVSNNYIPCAQTE